MSAPPQPLRIAILGGGCGALAAAFALTATPELRRRHQVTLYQRGWRLGGKGASGRNLARGARIEEHGLHMWMGWYRAAFRLLAACYAERDAPPGDPLRRMEDAFEPQYRATLQEEVDVDGVRGWRDWHIDLPPTPGSPWGGTPSTAPRLLAGLFGWLRSQLALARAGTGHDARRLLLLADLAQAMARGLVRDVLPPLGRGFDSIDHLEFRDWLLRHGARPESVWSPPVRALYSVGFAFLDGRTDREHAGAAAGVALRTASEMLFGYRGAPLWRMRGGMGDVVFAPLYQVLAARGVRFEFFHRVDQLGLAPGRDALERVELTRQVALRSDGYRPLVDVGGMACWPSEPLWDQIEGGAAAAAGIDLEGAGRSPGVERIVLERGEHFDRVVLGVAVGGLGAISGELAARSAAWRAMLTLPTVATQAVQLWLDRPTEALGWRGGASVLTGAEPPLDSWAEMSHLLPAERWGERGPRAIHYLCGALDDRATDGDSGVRDRAAGWLGGRAARLFPDAAAAGGFAAALHSAPGESPDQRLAAQYFRANLDPSDRYVLSPPGAMRLRLHPGRSGFDGLYLAGDWTWTRVGCGCVEAAVQSGLLAAEAISAAPPA